MTGGGIRIEVAGGSAQFGNVSQGDRNTNEARLAQSASDAFAEFYRELGRLADQPSAGAEEVAALRREIASLQGALEEKPAARRSIGTIAKSLYEDYAWAVEPLTKLFRVIAV